MKQYFKDILESIWSVALGMIITFKHLFTRACTLQYPDERWTLPERSRMRLFNKIEDCIGCGQCVRACPVDCIYMTTEKRTKRPRSSLPMGRRSSCGDAVLMIDVLVQLSTRAPIHVPLIVRHTEYELVVHNFLRLSIPLAKDSP
jgi:ferredoxin